MQPPQPGDRGGGEGRSASCRGAQNTADEYQPPAIQPSRTKTPINIANSRRHLRPQTPNPPNLRTAPTPPVHQLPPHNDTNGPSAAESAPASPNSGAQKTDEKQTPHTHAGERSRRENRNPSYIPERPYAGTGAVNGKEPRTTLRVCGHKTPDTKRKRTAQYRPVKKMQDAKAPNSEIRPPCKGSGQAPDSLRRANEAQEKVVNRINNIN